MKNRRKAILDESQLEYAYMLLIYEKYKRFTSARGVSKELSSPLQFKARSNQPGWAILVFQVEGHLWSHECQQ